MPNALDVLQQIFENSIQAHQKYANNHASLKALDTAASVIFEATERGNKVIAFGNGGSAADAQHLVAELVGRFEMERRALPAIALTTNTSVLTAIANDYAYDRVFVRQIEALGNSGDVAIGISTSGKSANVEAALEAAKHRGLTTIALTGRDGGPMGRAADIHLNVAEQATPRIQEVHRTLMHAMCSLVERRLGTAAAV